MIITKTIANDVATRMLQAKKISIKTTKNDLCVKLRNLCLEMVPADITKVYKKHQSYIKTTNQANVSGVGFHENYMNIGESIPSSHGSTLNMNINKEQSNQFQDLVQAIKTKEKEYSDLFTQIEVALTGLKTSKNVEKEFPEAFPYLPKEKVATGLILNIGDLRNKLK